MSDVIIEKKNEVFLKIHCEPHIMYELKPHFTFQVESAKFMPQYRNKYWNGEINLLNITNGELYVGLLDKLIGKLNSYGYSYEFKDNKFYGTPFEINEGISYEGVRDYMNSICSHSPRDYQIDGVYDALKHNRKLLISPTASGKSLMIYSLVHYYMHKDKKILVVVPTTSLVSQMYKDFEDYGMDAQSYCHMIYSGREKTNNHPITITTWQSIYKLDKSFFENYDVIIGDEAHTFKSKSLTSIMIKLHEAKYRFGFTGTLDGSSTHKWILEGLFGECKQVTKTEKLIKEGYLSDFRIKVLLLQHEKTQFLDYQSEIDAIVDNQKRNKLIKNLVRDLEGNTLVLFNYVERHGMPLHESINSVVKNDRKVFLVYGGVDTEEREDIRRITETESDAIIVASYGTFSTGINIKNLHNVVFASPSKSRVRNLQSIGRVLRKGNNKTYATLYDIADEYCRTPQKNYTLKHLDERLKIYEEEKFNVEIIKIDLK